MNPPLPSPDAELSVATAQALLEPFTCLEPGATPPLSDPETIRVAVLQLTQVTDNQILGILASSWAEALQALQSYTRALGHPFPTQLPEPQEPVYLKYNPRSGLCYASPYLEQHRGVLISFQSDAADGLNELYGHLPLNLFLTP